MAVWPRVAFSMLLSFASPTVAIFSRLKREMVHFQDGTPIMGTFLFAHVGEVHGIVEGYSMRNRHIASDCFN